MFQTTTNRRVFFFSQVENHTQSPIATSLSCASAKASMASGASEKIEIVGFTNIHVDLVGNQLSRKSRLLYNLYFQ